VKSREELLQELAADPAAAAEYTLQLQEQLAQKEQLLTEKEQLLAEARAYIAELKRQLFGPKADKLTAEQEEQLRQLSGDLKEQAQRPPPSARTYSSRTSLTGIRKPSNSSVVAYSILCRSCNWKSSAWCWSPKQGLSPLSATGTKDRRGSHHRI
jgi:hypothetical protein